MVGKKNIIVSTSGYPTCIHLVFLCFAHGKSLDYCLHSKLAKNNGLNTEYITLASLAETSGKLKRQQGQLIYSYITPCRPMYGSHERPYIVLDVSWNYTNTRYTKEEYFRSVYLSLAPISVI